MPKVTLVGGPGDGEEHNVEKSTTLLQWKPTSDRDQVLLRMHGCETSAVRYRRSLRTQTLFVYQP